MAKRARAAANPTPATNGWKATITVHPKINPGVDTLVVTGQVDVGYKPASASLVEASPQGTNPKVLLLNLRIGLEREGVPKHVFKEAKFVKTSERGQYTSVNIVWFGEVIADMPVVPVG